jgi:hypothetical protein
MRWSDVDTVVVLCLHHQQSLIQRPIVDDLAWQVHPIVAQMATLYIQ